LIIRALDPRSTAYLPLPSEHPDPRYFFGAPIWSQAKRIFWNDIKKMIPAWAYERDPVRSVSESDMCIKLKSGAEIWVIGMDKPQRIEGTPWDGGVLDEYGNMKPQAWAENVRPALADRQGWCDFIGVPEGRNHYYDLAEVAKRVGEEARARGEIPEWDFFHWKSAEILPVHEVESARNDLDPLTFKQEFEGDFIHFQGRVYYPFEQSTHCRPLRYDPEQPISICFDFNISPGVAVVCQEQQLPGVTEPFYDERRNETFQNPVFGTGVIGEVFIPKNSNTVMVCNRLLQDWHNHRGEVHVYGDASGGSGGSAQVEGSDWDLVRKMFKDQWKKVYYFIPSKNPQERIRVNALNSRLMSTTGIVRLIVDDKKCPNVVRDLEGTRLVEGGDGSIDKRATPDLTHLTDALGYYVVYRFPVQEVVGRSVELLW